MHVSQTEQTPVSTQHTSEQKSDHTHKNSTDDEKQVSQGADDHSHGNQEGQGTNVDTFA